MPPTTASALPDPIQPTIYYMEAVLPVELQSVTKLLHFSASTIDSHGKNMLPPPFSRSSISFLATPSPVSSSMSSCSTLGDDDESNRESSSISLPLNPAKDNSNKLIHGKQYVCKFCFKKFMRPSSLKIHIYSHTGEKPFNCTHPGCRRKFSVQSNMRRHLRVHSS
ncbi:uncharacterized protein ATC70_010199 [Mucor velutinosus]|uniref:C2H2-type domain-containing protein n=1 Tax=Mucor velutinosus TaxID=708070 RepID=A0AAN7DPU9_9FUNG|nr:hypothetical protein ATC70_010199 [Mucor velutinosus]